MGKSFFARHLLRQVAKKKWPILIIDGTAHMWAEEYAKDGGGTVDKPRLVSAFNPKFLCQIYQPDPDVEGWEDSKLLGILSKAYQHKNILIYFDELFDIIDAHHAPKEIRRLWTQGRKMRVAAWAGVQEPKDIPRFVMSQTENWAMFRITDEDQLDNMSKRMSSPQIRKKLIDRFFFWYYHSTMDTAQLMAPLPKEDKKK